MRLKAKKTEIHRFEGVTYYNIFVGKSKIAEYISEIWVDRIVNGFNLLQEKEDAETALRKKIRDIRGKNYE